MKVIHSYIRNTRKKLVENGFNCRIEYYNYGYDLECGGKKYLLLKITRTGKAVMTYAEYLDAKSISPQVLIVDGEGNVLYEMSFSDFLKWFYGLRKINAVVKLDGIYVTLKPAVVAGRLGVEVPVFLNKKEYSELLERLKHVRDPIECLKNLLLER